jgi:hypothetical protein
MPSEVFTQMKTYFESTTTGFYPYDDRTNAPFVSTDVFAISDCVVKSITIPVFSTGKADEDGDFTFSIYIVPNDWASLRTELADPADPIVVKINAEEYELAENSLIRKFIKVDLTEYEIELSDKETLGFSHKDDTLIPARVLVKGTETVNGKSEKYAPAKYLIDNWDVVGYYYHDRSDDSFTYIDNSLFFDFELERTWESEAVYNALIAKQAEEQADYAMKIAAIKNAYAGKTISVMGDSISTFNGITNNATLGLADNPVYSKYTLGAAVYTYERTYWGKLAFEAGMELNIINSWGGGKVYGWNKVVNETTGKSYNFNDCMLRRSYNLAKDGNAPDLILLNYGINDMSGSYSSIQAATSSAYSGNLATGSGSLRHWEYKFHAHEFRKRLDALTGGKVWRYCEASPVLSAAEMMRLWKSAGLSRRRYREEMRRYLADAHAAASLKAFPLSWRHPLVALAVNRLRIGF